MGGVEGLRPGGLAWAWDIWVWVLMQSPQPEHGPHAAHKALGVHRVRGCDRAQCAGEGTVRAHLAPAPHAL